MPHPVKQPYPIKLGTFLFTMVEPHKGHEVAYNRWYEHDHFYSGCMVGAYNFAGDRFVATKRLKQMRSTTPNDMTPDPMTGSYVAIYWVLADHHDDWNRWSVDNVIWLHQNGRMFTDRTHVHTALYDHQWARQRDPNGCTIELALDHGYPGIVAVAGELNDGVTHEQMGTWWNDEYLPTAMSKPSGPELVSYAKLLPLLDDAPADVPRPANSERRFLTLHFLDHDPEVGWADSYAKVGEAMNASGLATHVWTGPFMQTVFGTDTYTDELW
jgi:hypothetical protein